MFSESAELYDTIYGALKDYSAESAAIAAVIRSAHPTARRILDVGCGTGEHARQLTQVHGFEVDGLDLDPALLAVARRKLPQARFHQGDMGDFALGRRYQVVICLFSAIGYLLTTERLAGALRCFREHVDDDGAVIVEPWFRPEVLRVGPGPTQTVAIEGGRVERSSLVAVEGRLSTLTFDYRIEGRTGVRTAREVHRLGLFTEAEMTEQFRAAGLVARFDPDGLTGRGLYVARPATGGRPTP